MVRRLALPLHAGLVSGGRGAAAACVRGRECVARAALPALCLRCLPASRSPPAALLTPPATPFPPTHIAHMSRLPRRQLHRQLECGERRLPGQGQLPGQRHQRELRRPVPRHREIAIRLHSVRLSQRAPARPAKAKEGSTAVSSPQAAPERSHPPATCCVRAHTHTPAAALAPTPGASPWPAGCTAPSLLCYLLRFTRGPSPPSRAGGHAAAPPPTPHLLDAAPHSCPRHDVALLTPCTSREAHLPSPHACASSCPSAQKMHLHALPFSSPLYPGFRRLTVGLVGGCQLLAPLSGCMCQLSPLGCRLPRARSAWVFSTYAQHRHREMQGEAEQHRGCAWPCTQA